MVVDVHSHYMPRVLARALERRTAAPRIHVRDGASYVEYGPGSGTPLTAGFTDPDEILARMGLAGINHAVLSVTIPGVDWFAPDEAEEVALASNEETAAIVARHPERFSGLATVPLQAPERAARVLQEAARLGLKGAMVYSNVAGAPIDEPARREFFAASAELGLPVMLHPTYPLCAPSTASGGLMEMAGFLFDTATAALRLVFDGLYERHPDFKFLVPHTGSVIPWLIGRIDLVASVRPGARGAIAVAPSEHVRRFYVDTVTGTPESVRLCRGLFGLERILHGTDHPFWPMSIGPDLLERCGLTTRERAMVEHENATRLFDLRLGAGKAS